MPRALSTLLVLVLCLTTTGCGLLGRKRSVDVDHPLIEMPSGVEYEELMTGRGPAVDVGDTVTIDYRGFLPDGTMFDSTYDRGMPVTFVVGEAPLAGWNEALLGMRPGGRRRISLPPELAYGEEGYPGLIPPSATLVFEIELGALDRPEEPEDPEAGAGPPSGDPDGAGDEGSGL